MARDSEDQVPHFPENVPGTVVELGAKAPIGAFAPPTSVSAAEPPEDLAGWQQLVSDQIR